MTQPVEILYAVPVGAVIPWYPPPNAQLPPGFAYCDGTLVSDKDSPFNGQPTPNLQNRFPLGAGGSVKPNQEGGNVQYNLDGWNSGTLSTSATQAGPQDNVQNQIIERNQPTASWRYDLTQGDEGWNDGNHHHVLGNLQVPAPGWVALTYLIRIK